MKEEKLIQELAKFLVKKAEKDEELLGRIREEATLAGEQFMDEVHEKIREILKERLKNGIET